ncbi:MAG: hypothetical protein PHQ24_09555, partial [Proteiniphilum sp.]|nr:hypothetical protein [Proteiniphilum sp.]
MGYFCGGSFGDPGGDIAVAIGDYLNQTITLATYNGQNAMGDPSYNADVSLNARVSFRQKLRYTRDGKEVMSFCHVTLEEEVEYEDLIALDDGIKRVPIAIRHARGKDGTLHHTGV